MKKLKTVLRFTVMIPFGLIAVPVAIFVEWLIDGDKPREVIRSFVDVMLLTKTP